MRQAERGPHLAPLLETVQRRRAIGIRLDEPGDATRAGHGLQSEVGQDAAGRGERFGFQVVVQQVVGDLDLRDPGLRPPFERRPEPGPRRRVLVQCQRHLATRSVGGARGEQNSRRQEHVSSGEHGTPLFESDDSSAKGAPKVDKSSSPDRRSSGLIPSTRRPPV